jgi:hypothetical protein
MKDLIEVGLALLIALLLVVLATTMVIASWLLFGFVVSWGWNTFVVTYNPELPTLATVEVAVGGFLLKLIKDTIWGRKE